MSEELTEKETRRAMGVQAALIAPLLVLGLVALLVSPPATAFPDGPRLGESSSPTTAVAGKPNVLVIVTDDQRIQTYSMMPRTRRLLKRKGVNFNHAVTTTPMCCPARASIFSGKYVHNHGVTSMDNPENLDHSETLQRELQRNGYRTAVVGKYLNNWVGDPPFFDRWAISDPHKNYLDVIFNVNGTPVGDTGYITSFETKMASRFLGGFLRKDDKPWMLYVAPYAPHEPALPHWRHRGADVPKFQNTPATRETNLRDKPLYVRRAVDDISKSQLKKFRRKQLRSLKSADELVGELINKLKRKDALDDTLIIFASDNGYQWYEHGLDKKFYPYEYSVRVPMLMRWDGHLSRSVDSRLVANIDIAPTIYDAANISPTYTVDGRSLLTSFTRDRILLELSSYQGVPTWYSFYAKRWQYIEYPADGFREYYGPKDPWQLSNVYANAKSGDEPLNGAQLSAELATARTCQGSSCP